MGRPNPQLTKDIQAGIGVDKYIIDTKDVSTENTNVGGLCMSEDGSSFYMVGYNTDKIIYQYSLSTNYVIATAVYSNKFFDVSSQASTPYDLKISPDGTKAYVLDRDTTTIFQYNLSTPFDITTSVYSSHSYSLGSQLTYPRGIDFSNSGTKLYVVCQDNDTIYEYSLSVGYDISAASYSGNSYLLSDSVLGGLHVSEDGEKLYVSGLGTDKFYEYSFGTNYDVSTLSISGEHYFGGITSTFSSLDIVDGGTRLYSNNAATDTIYSFSMDSYDIYSLSSGGTLEGNPQQPILYLPMTDASTAHINSGTGGDFLQNGTLATADVGANQDQCKASEFDGVDDYLSSGSISTINNTLFTYSAVFKFNTTNDFSFVSRFSSDRFQLYEWSEVLTFRLENTSSTAIAEFTLPSVKIKGISIALTVSLDLTDSNNRHVIVNGEEVAPVWTTYTNADISINSEVLNISTSSETWNGSIGEVYLDGNYIDLATSNPFWNDTTNRPNSVRKVMRDIESNPLIAMPIDASNPTKNWGSGGDFTLFG